MSDPNDKDEPTKKAGGMSGWTIILFWAGIAGVFWIAQLIEDDGSWSGRDFLGWVFGLAVLGIFVNIIWGATFRETFQNFKGVAKAVLGLFVAVMIIGGIGNCSGGGGSGGSSSVPDNWRK